MCSWHRLASHHHDAQQVRLLFRIPHLFGRSYSGHAAGLADSFLALRRAIECLELDEYCEATVLGEPQLGRRGLYPNLSTRESGAQVKDMMNLLAYSDGHLSLFEIAEIIEVPFWRVEPLARKLMDAGVLRRRSRL